MKRIILILIVLFLLGCVESITENPNTVPEIEIYKPLSNDTLQIGKNYINYAAKDYFQGPGLDRFELVFNDDEENFKEYKVKNNVNPVIYLDIDPVFLGSIGSYFIKVYNKEGRVTFSKKMTNLYIGENNNKPEAPDSLQIVRVSTSEVILLWKDQSVNEDGFEIFMKEGEQGQYKPIATVGAGKTTYKATSLSPYILYFFKVRAFNTKGASAFSNEVNSSQAGGNEPYDLRGEAHGATIVQLYWRNMTYIYEAIIVQRKHETATFWEDIEKDISETAEEYLDLGKNNLFPSTRYNYRIAAKILGAWVYSNVILIKTFNENIDAPKNLTATFNIANNSNLITWDHTLQEDKIEEIIIQRREQFDNVFVDIAKTGNNKYKYEDLNIKQNKTYYYRAKYLTSEQFYTIWSNQAKVEVGEFAPNAPTDLRISKIDNATNQYFIEWKDNSNDEDGFRIYYKLVGTSFYNEYTPPLSANKTFATISLPTSNEYNVIVKSFKGSLLSAASNEVSTKDIIISFNLKSTYDAIKNEVKLDWSDLGTMAEAYRVYRGDITTSPVAWTEIGNVANTTTFTDKSVNKKQTYYYKIIAYLKNSNKVESQVITVGTY